MQTGDEHRTADDVPERHGQDVVHHHLPVRDLRVRVGWIPLFTSHVILQSKRHDSIDDSMLQ